MTDWQDFKIASPYDDSPDAQAAAEDELQQVINTQNVPAPIPQEQFNPAVPYAHTTIDLTDKDKILLKAIQKAVDNGWIGWRTKVNDAVTIGMEAEQLVKEMKRYKTDVRTLLFDQEFAEFLFGEDWQKNLQEMVLERDAIMYVKRTL